MLKLRKGELKFYMGMTPRELNEYIRRFPINTEYVVYFLERHEYNYVKEIWKKGRTI